MKLLGFNFNKISVEKLGEKPAETKVSTNINVSEIKAVKVAMLKSKEDVLGIKFAYKVSYSPDYAEVDLQGAIMVSLEPKVAKKVLKEWDSKKMPEEFQGSLFNLILAKSSVKALQLEEEMNLPFHIPLPSVKPQDK
jgi:hypothetical protein